ncbi:radical SAM family heme chaperone HemW [Clostridium oceanicum]|uniref:radical SAM family heme chaperone HemW n=1 Tax=Clostridium oceanicum TaxID=1543 RepID=UPI0031D2F805
METKINGNSISLYIHIPFCKQKCLYCDFISYSNKESLKKEYIKALSKEISIVTKNRIINTIFIGGGTPTYLSLEELKILKRSIDEIHKDINLEFTVEGNPGTFTLEKLKLLKSMGVNRLSIGLQSFDDALLKKLGRIHNAKEFIDSFKKARLVGFNNINIDLMFGLPGQSFEVWKDTLNKVLTLKPEHLSCYSLIVEENTPFYNMYNDGVLNLPGEDREREMYEYCINFLAKNGYNQYEISNFAKYNKECRHNLVYWNMKEYLGCGVGAHSYIKGYRYKNTSLVEEYINYMKDNSLIKIREESHKNTLEEEIEEFIFMGLRKIKGISIKEFTKRFKIDIFNLYGNIINKYVKLGFLILKKDTLKLSKEGINVSNTILSDFVLK